MVNADRSNNYLEMGAFAVRKHEQNGSAGPLIFSKPIDTGSKIYKLMINIEKIRPKPCPRSKKFGYPTLSKTFDQNRGRVLPISANQLSLLPKKKVICTICKEQFQSVQSLYLHKKKRHCYICNICNTEWTTKSAFDSHEKIHKLAGTEIGKSEKPQTRVSLRSDTAHKKQIMQNAERMSNLENSEKIGEKSRKNEGRSLNNYGSVTFTCRVCSKDFSSVEEAEEHTMDHMEVVEEEQKCSICKKLFRSEKLLNDHLAEHLSRALRCPVCPKAFINRATLRIHMKSHGQG